MHTSEIELDRSIKGLVEEGAAFEQLSNGRPRGARVRPSRRFHIGMALAFLATAFAAFAPTYYLKSVIQAPHLSPVLHLHAVAFTTWLVLLLVQTALVASHRVNMHRNLGMFGAALATAMVPLGLMTAVAGARAKAALPGQDPKALLVFQMGAIVMFAAFFGAALWTRKRPEFHRRLIMLATICLMPAAIARLPLVGLRPMLAMLLSLLFIVAGVIHDLRARGRVHPVYVWGGSAILLSGPLRYALGQTSAWQSFARFLVEQS